MQRDRTSAPVRLRDFALLLAVSLCVSMVFLARRNLYDDELASYHLILRPFRELVAAANSVDLHPPGMYALSRVAWLVTRSVRWSALIPLLFVYGGLAAFACSLARHLRDRRERAVVTFLVLGNPHMLLWGSSIRWYSYWTGLFLLLFAWFFFGARRESTRNAVLLGASLGALTYLSYVTLLAAPCMVLAWLLCDGWTRTRVLQALSAAVAAVAVALPQLVVFVSVHLGARDSQMQGVPVALARLAHGALLGEAMMPWHVLAPVIVAAVVLSLVCAGRAAWAHRTPRNTPVHVMLVFSALLAAAATATGLGAKPRSFCVLAVMVSALAGIGALRIQRTSVRRAVLGCFAVWYLVSWHNMIFKVGLAKGGLTDRVDEVVEVVHERAGERPAVIFCHHPGLIYELNALAAKEGLRWSVVGMFEDYIHDVPAGFMKDVSPEVVFVAESSVGSIRDKAAFDAAYRDALGAVAIEGKMNLSRDPDVWMKRRMAGKGEASALLPEYRFTLSFGAPKPGVDLRALARAFGAVH